MMLTQREVVLMFSAAVLGSLAGTSIVALAGMAFLLLRNDSSEVGDAARRLGSLLRTSREG